MTSRSMKLNGSRFDSSTDQPSHAFRSTVTLCFENLRSEEVNAAIKSLPEKGAAERPDGSRRGTSSLDPHGLSYFPWLKLPRTNRTDQWAMSN